MGRLDNKVATITGGAGRISVQVGRLYDQTGFILLVSVSAAFAPLCWLMISLLRSEEPVSMEGQ